MDNVTLKSRASEKIEAWKKEVGQLKNQLEHNQEEAKDYFEKKKSALVNWTEEMKEEFERMEGVGEEKLNELRGNLEELRLQAALGRMDSKDAAQEQQKKINKSIHNLKNSFVKMEKEGEKDAKEFYQKAAETLDNYNTKFEMFRLQMMYGKDDAVQSFKDRKNNIAMKLDKLNTQLEVKKEVAEDRWEHFSEEISEAWTHLKKAISV